jgi:hypothetical protein
VPVGVGLASGVAVGSGVSVAGGVDRPATLSALEVEAPDPMMIAAAKAPANTSVATNLEFLVVSFFILIPPLSSNHIKAALWPRQEQVLLLKVGLLHTPAPLPKIGLIEKKPDEMPGVWSAIRGNSIIYAGPCPPQDCFEH